MDSYETNISQSEAMPSLEKQESFANSPERQISVPERISGAESLNDLTKPVLVQPTSAQPAVAKTISSRVIRAPISVASRYSDVPADDGDVIERQWIDGVKKTIHETKNQPMRRNDELEETKKIYQQKRRGLQ